MKTFRSLFFAGLILISGLLHAQETKKEIAIIAFYNVENLFDTINDPLTRDEEFLPDGQNAWNTEKYVTKLDRLSEVIRKIGEEFVSGGPTILGLSEIENRLVMEDLIKTERLQPLQYGIVHYDSPDRRGVDVGLIYKKGRFVLEGSHSFPLITEDTSFRTRDQLLVWGKLDGELMYFMVNHWPSRRGGEARSSPLREAAARLSRHIADSLMKSDPNAKIIIMGDLNDDPSNISVKKVLGAKAKPADVGPGELFNPMYKLYQDGIGSYAYRDAWNLLDQLIISHGLLKGDNTTYRYHQAKVFNPQFIKQKTGTFAGYPWRSLAGGQYLAGYSDHFPVYLILMRGGRK